SHPAPIFDKIDAHFGRLAQADAAFPGPVQGMILLSKLPPSMDAINSLLHMTAKLSELTPKGICDAAVSAWEQRSSRRAPSGSAHKLSAIKRKFPDPSFQAQQQPNGSAGKGNWKGKQRQRGKRAGKKFPQNPGQNTGHAHLASQLDATPHYDESTTFYP